MQGPLYLSEVVVRKIAESPKGAVMTASRNRRWLRIESIRVKGRLFSVLFTATT